MIDVSELGEFNLDDFLDEMGGNTSQPESPKRVIKKQVVLALDASNSMHGYKIGAVNDVVNNLITKLKTLDRSSNYSISIHVIGFAARLFRWNGTFVPVSEFQYSYVETADGLTNMKALFEELTNVTDHHMNDDAEKYTVLFSDGLSTEDYVDSANQWKNTGRYKDIHKIAVSFDEDLEDVQSAAFFQDFTHSGPVLPIQDIERLYSLLLG